MSLPHGIFLTGATGLLGRFILRDLLASGFPVAVLIRDSQAEMASERLAQLRAFGEESLQRKLPRPTLLVGDLNTANMGLSTTERLWLGQRVRTVIHSAAYVAYHTTLDGEPWATNVEGTRRLLTMCRSLGLTDVHYLSTAFICGDRRGIVYEDELDCGGGCGNAYERSKFAAEQLVRGFDGIRATVYRPSVVVGDSRTGYTSTYHHFYRFLELAVRLAGRTEGPSEKTRIRRKRLPVRLPLTGEETQNLVTVDWVAQAFVALLRRPAWHGRTFHLAAHKPLRLCEITAMIEEALQIEGIHWVGADGLTDPTTLEEMVREQFQDYWSYLRNALLFDCCNTCLALSDLPPPPFDRDLLVRLLHFAQRDGWGRDRSKARLAHSVDFTAYLEQTLPRQMQQSPLAALLPPRLAFRVSIHGEGGGQWLCRWANGRLRVQRGMDADALLTYRIDTATFADLIQGRQSPRQAFDDGRIEIEGDLEKALQLALFIESFLAESAERTSCAEQKQRRWVGCHEMGISPRQPSGV